jgi:hypothetical protein
LIAPDQWEHDGRTPTILVVEDVDPNHTGNS